jgi:hypothetical protein
MFERVRVTAGYWRGPVRGLACAGAVVALVAILAACQTAPATDLQLTPLALPTVAPGTPCPVTQPHQVTVNLADGSKDHPQYVGAQTAVGNGPAYILGGGTVVIGTGAPPVSGVTRPPNNTATQLWIVDPSYSGPILVRGGQIDGSGTVRFKGGVNGSQSFVAQLSLAGGEQGPPVWTSWPTQISLSAPGCYAYQVNGTGFSEIIVFRVMLAM